MVKYWWVYNRCRSCRGRPTVMVRWLDRHIYLSETMALGCGRCGRVWRFSGPHNMTLEDVNSEEYNIGRPQ